MRGRRMQDDGRREKTCRTRMALGEALWEDFTIADGFGADAVHDTFRRAFGEWRDDPTYLGELCMTVNHKSWQHHRCWHPGLSRMYADMYYKCRDYAYGDDSPYSDDDRRILFEITD